MNNKLWANKLHKPLSSMADEFNSSIKVDARMYAEDIKGSAAHAAMLGAQGIIDGADSAKIVAALSDILKDLECGTLKIDENAEDIHTFVEGELTARIGEAGKMLHTARSRNDQVALDTRLYLAKEIEVIIAHIKSLMKVITDIAKENTKTVMSGYTHLQQAQPVTFAHWILAYAAMLARDVERLNDCNKRVKISPLGSCALAGTSFPVDRAAVADALGFSGVGLNSMDGVSDRDFVIELSAAIAVIMMHLSRFSEEIILFSTKEFGYITLSDSYSTGSSIMPQKKNPDIAELVRGKTGRTYGNLFALLTTMKALPLAYNKDMQEDKEAIFDSVDTVKFCLKCFAEMLSEMTINKVKMLENADKGFINATEVADYLTAKGVPFRTAYQLTGELVAECIEGGYTLGTLPMDIYLKKSKLFGTDIYSAVDITNAAMKKTSEGGPAEAAVLKQIDIILGVIND